MKTNEAFEKWYREHGQRYYTVTGHQGYMKHAFNAGLDAGRALQVSESFKARKMPEPFYLTANVSYNWK